MHPPDAAAPLGLFEGFGVEIEVILVDADSLDVRPVADRLLEAVAGAPVADVEFGPLAWSNELALHVLEFKTNGPAANLRGLAKAFHAETHRANEALAALGCRLLPGGMHPWMDPAHETRLWPHESTEVYRTFDRIFSCQGHGWSNLQSTHLNLPFGTEEEFRSLHAAVRGLLPLLPALAASSPYHEGRHAGALDQRLLAYAGNARQVPSVTGLVVPEPADSPRAYREGILEPLYRDLAPHDPEGILRHEWVNARGAIARFERDSIEIRILDPQECAAADLAVVGAVARVGRDLCDRVLEGDARFVTFPTERLADALDRVTREAGHARIEDRRYLEALGIRHPGRRCYAVDLWWELLDRVPRPRWEGPGPVRDAEGRDALTFLLERGSLAQRLLGAAGPAPDRDRLREVYRVLADSLAENRLFSPET